MNAQLKKKHGRQCISSLVEDMQDGTAFADLIEVIGKYVVDMAVVVFRAVVYIIGIVCSYKPMGVLLFNIIRSCEFLCLIHVILLYLLQESHITLNANSHGVLYQFNNCVNSVHITIIADFAAGETLPGVIYSPSNKNDMLSNINQVISFMTERNIRMHVTYAEG